MCGIIGMISQENILTDLYYGLLNLQHRGKESAAIAFSDGGQPRRIGDMGEIAQAFQGHRIDQLTGTIGIGQTRYSTTGMSSSSNLQPLRGTFAGRAFYLAHNGNLVNTQTLKKITGSEESASDSRVIVELIEHLHTLYPSEHFEDILCATAKKLRGSFCLVLLYDNKLYAMRDAFGFHPLIVGRRGNDVVVASESCALDHIGATIANEVAPGSLMVIPGAGGIQTRTITPPIPKIDLFEYIYFLRPDSILGGMSVRKARYQMGWHLGMLEKTLPTIDRIAPIPDSGNASAMGYYDALKERGSNARYTPDILFRPHTVSRTFIEPINERRHHLMSMKFNLIPHLIAGHKIILVDDSLVRGTTLTNLVKRLRDAGAIEVHARIPSPMYRYPDIYGVDTYRTDRELIAQTYDSDVEAIARACGLDSLAYLPVDMAIQAVLDGVVGDGTTLDTESFYTGPFTGDYPDGTGDITVAI